MPHLLDTATDDERAVVKEGEKEIKYITKRPFEAWMKIAHAIDVLYEVSMRITKKGAFVDLLKEAKFGDILGKTAKSQYSTAMDARQVHAKADDVRAWYKTQDPLDQMRWSHPRTILNHCPLFPQYGTRRRANEVRTDTVHSQVKHLK